MLIRVKIKNNLSNIGNKSEITNLTYDHDKNNANMNGNRRMGAFE